MTPATGSGRGVGPAAVATPTAARLLLAVTAVLGLLAFCWPLFMAPGPELGYQTRAPLLFAAILPVALAVVVSQLGSEGIDVKALAMLGVLTACGAALRPLGAGTAGIEFVFLLIILGGRVFGPAFGFVLGTTTMVTSGLITGGFGPWLPYQMVAAGFVGMGAAALPRLRGVAETVWLCGYGFVSAFAYGWLMDFAFWPFNLGLATDLSYQPGAPVVTNLTHFVLFNVATSMAWNLGRALTNVVAIAVVGPAILRVLRRASRRARWNAAEDPPASQDGSVLPKDDPAPQRDWVPQRD